MLSEDMKQANQMDKAVNTATAIISQLRNSITYFNPELVRLLYVSLIILSMRFQSLFRFESLFKKGHRKSGKRTT